MDASAAAEIADIVAICNVAQANHVGEFVWLSWCNNRANDPKFTGGKCHPTNGLTAAAVTVSGARKLIDEMYARGYPRHMDCWLLDEGIRKASVEASFVYPSMGGYMEHVSGCEATGKLPGDVRQAMWGRSFQVEGTRIGPDARDAGWTHRELRYLPHYKKEARRPIHLQYPVFDRQGLRELQWLTRPVAVLEDEVIMHPATNVRQEPEADDVRPLSDLVRGHSRDATATGEEQPSAKLTKRQQRRVRQQRLEAFRRIPAMPGEANHEQLQRDLPNPCVVYPVYLHVCTLW